MNRIRWSPAALLLGLLLALSGCSQPVGDADSDAAPGPGSERSDAASPQATGPVPERVSVPDIGVESELLDLGLQADGTLETPQDFDLAGWYDGGPVPGQTGPAIIAGHVDSTDGPAVFARLGELQTGSPVEVALSDGSVVEFRVNRIERYPRAEFPTEAVYGPAPTPVLRLITCGGEFDQTAGHYLDNVVVFASLAEAA